MNMTKIKWPDAFDNGFRVEKAYLLENNIPPNVFRYALSESYIDLEDYDFNILKEHFPNAVVTNQTIISEATTSCVEDDDEEVPYTETYIDGRYETCTCRIYNGTVFYVIEPDTVSIYYKDEDPKELYEELINLLEVKVPEPKQAEVQLIAYNQEYYTITSKVKPLDIDIKKNYNDDFLPVFDDIVKFINDRSSGLIVLRGTKGTGKTSLIKYLMSKYPNNYVIVTNAVAESLATPELMSFMLDHKDSIFILEDCEQILIKRELNNGSFGGAISNILNMSDGLMSDIFNIKFICTFNADITKIDEALLRKGRCFANYEFKELSEEKTKILLNEQNIYLDSYKPMTLADIYHYSDNDYETSAPKKFGF